MQKYINIFKVVKRSINFLEFFKIYEKIPLLSYANYATIDRRNNT